MYHSAGLNGKPLSLEDASCTWCYSTFSNTVKTQSQWIIQNILLTYSQTY